MTIVETAVDMSTSLGAVPIPSPVLTASGCSAFGRELEPFTDLAAIGAVVTKSVQLRPRSGRPTPRMAETPSGMLNSIGLQGPGIDGLLAGMADRFGDRPRLVHRLDRDTTGVLLVAKHRDAAAKLGRIFQTRSAAKTYWALVKGVPKPPQGKVEAALAGGLELTELSPEEGVVFNAEISAAIEENLAGTDYGALLSARGITVVALDDSGQIIEHRPDGSSSVLHPHR